MDPLLNCFLCRLLILKRYIAYSFTGMIRVKTQFQTNNWPILFKNLMQLPLLHILGYVFDKNLVVLVDVHYFFFESEGSALFIADFKISDFFAHFNVVGEFWAGDFHEAFEKLFFYVTMNDWHFIENNSSLFFHNSGKTVAGILNFWQIV